MALTAVKSSESSESNEFFGKTAREKVEDTYTEEVIIGICAPIGSLKEDLISELKKQLKEKYEYGVELKKLSNYIQLHASPLPTQNPGEKRGFTLMMNRIKGGNELRAKTKRNSVLAELAIKDILWERVKDAKRGDELPSPTQMRSRRVCYIIDSLKNIEEVRLLRSIYKDMFYMFSVFSPENERHNNLVGKDMSPSEAEMLMNTDEYENNDSGQNVRNTFTEADFFVRVSEYTKPKLSTRITRFLHLIFGTEIVTPLPNETAMYAAKSAAGNSACMSRQVGAAITDRNYNLLSKGWNDVPRFGGGLYFESNDMTAQDDRCWLNGKYCRNDKSKDVIADKIIDELFKDEEIKRKWLSDHSDNKDLKGLKDILRKIIRKKSPIRDLIEFSRAVHAEMHAIINGSQLTGSRMIGGKLFCTTYPCHNCARHIIAAGIEEVYYIEPYVKSLSTELHADAITEDEKAEHKVKLLVYEGVSPRKYLDFFTMNSNRKDENGNYFSPALKTQFPKFRISLQALATLEKQALVSLNESGLSKNISNEKG